MTAWLGPLALRTFRTLQADLITSQVSFALQPRVFDERFPKLVLYVNDVAAAGTQWHGVFLAETGGEGGSRLTLAEKAIVIAEPKLGKLELHLQGGTTHEFSREDADHYSVTAFGQSDWPIEFSGLAAAEPRQINNSERSVRELLNDKGPGWREARVEFHRRLSFPIACFAFALIAVPLGAQPRRGGRAAGALLAVILIAAYYLLTVVGAGFARQGTLPPRRRNLDRQCRSYSRWAWRSCRAWSNSRRNLVVPAGRLFSVPQAPVAPPKGPSSRQSYRDKRRKWRNA